MADSRQAAKWMQEGKRVYSMDSLRSQPIYMNEFEQFFNARTGTVTRIALADLLADDWEIAE